MPLPMALPPGCHEHMAFAVTSVMAGTRRAARQKSCIGSPRTRLGAVYQARAYVPPGSRYNGIAVMCGRNRNSHARDRNLGIPGTSADRSGGYAHDHPAPTSFPGRATLARRPHPATMSEKIGRASCRETVYGMFDDRILMNI